VETLTARGAVQVALGSLGVVAEATLQCVPAHRLVECTWCGPSLDPAQ
jgi:hypothetical protein